MRFRVSRSGSPLFFMTSCLRKVVTPSILRIRDTGSWKISVFIL